VNYLNVSVLPQLMAKLQVKKGKVKKVEQLPEGKKKQQIMKQISPMIRPVINMGMGT